MIELYVEKDNQRYGPFYPVDGPIPLHRYCKFKKTRRTSRPDCNFGFTIGLPTRSLGQKMRTTVLRTFKVPEPLLTPLVTSSKNLHTPPLLRRQLLNIPAQPLARLSAEQRAFIDAPLVETLNKKGGHGAGAAAFPIAKRLSEINMLNYRGTLQHA